MSKYCVSYKATPGYYDKNNHWFPGYFTEHLWETKDIDVKAEESRGFTVKAVHWSEAHRLVRNGIVHSTGLWYDGERIRYATGE